MAGWQFGTANGTNRWQRFPKPLGLGLLLLLFLRALSLDLKAGEDRQDLASSQAAPPNSILFASLLPGQADLVVFYESDCSTCIKLKPFIETTLRQHSRLKARWVDLAIHPLPGVSEQNRYLETLPPLESKQGGVPMVFIGGRRITGKAVVRQNLAADLALYLNGALPPPYHAGANIERGSVALASLPGVVFLSLLAPPALLLFLFFLLSLGAARLSRSSSLTLGSVFVLGAGSVAFVATLGGFWSFYQQGLLDELPRVVKFGIVIGCLLLALVSLLLVRRQSHPISTPALPGRGMRIALVSLAGLSGAMTMFLAFPFLARDDAKALYYASAFGSHGFPDALALLAYAALMVSPLLLMLALSSLAQRHLSRSPRRLPIAYIGWVSATAALIVGIVQASQLAQEYHLW